MWNKIDKFDGTQYAFLSNFYKCPVVVPPMTIPFRTSEHAYQALKMLDFKDMQAVANARTPAKAKQLGNTLKKVPDWDDIKLKVMENVLKAKFSIPEMKVKLLETGDAILEEGNTWGDKFWGTVNGVGENHLGKLLMKVRKELQNEAKETV